MIHGISFHGDAHSKTRVNLHMKFNAFCVKGEIFPEIRIHIENVITCVFCHPHHQICYETVFVNYAVQSIYQ